MNQEGKIYHRELKEKNRGKNGRERKARDTAKFNLTIN